MATKNDITGDTLITKPSSAYGDNYDAIFRKPIEPIQQELDLGEPKVPTNKPIKHTN